MSSVLKCSFSHLDSFEKIDFKVKDKHILLILMNCLTFSNVL